MDPYMSAPRSANDDITDLELARNARSGDWQAFQEIVRRYQMRVYGLAMRILRHAQDAEDATQQTFLSVLENLDGFREESSLATWILRIATNHALKIIRKRQAKPASEPVDYASVPHPEYIAQWRDGPESLAQRAEVRELLAGALDELDEKYRSVFVLRDIQEHSTAETAEMLGITKENVKIRLLRARLQLREKLTRQFGDESTRVFPDHEHD